MRNNSTANIAIIVPTFNERENVAPLIDELALCLVSHEWQVLFVDDNSPDGTADEVERLGVTDSRVKCLRRVGRKGLSSACIEGILASDAPFVAVMDGDLQHDIKILPQMIEAVSAGKADLAIGSRYTEGGDINRWSFWRKVSSGLATRVSHILIPDGLTDPMSGYFVMRRDRFVGLVDRLYGKGFKILLDIISSSRDELSFIEIPYSFGVRQHGESKLNTLVAYEFGEMLAYKTVGRLVPPKFLLFVGVGLTGMLVHLIVLGVFNRLLFVSFELSQFLATWAAMTSNFRLNNIVTYRETQLREQAWWRGLFTFYASCGLGAFINLTIAICLYGFGTHWLVAGVSGAVIGAIWNFSTTSIFTWENSDP